MNHRPALIGAASLAGVVLAGVAAVGANLGILGNADSGSIGELSAANVATTEPQIVDVYVDDTGSPQSANAQEFAVDAAGTVSLLQDGNGFRLDQVQPNPGWSWARTRASAAELEVDFRSGSATYAFIAVLNPDGTIAARVDQPRIEPTPAPTSARHDDEGDRDGDSNDEHEGRDDDD